MYLISQLLRVLFWFMLAVELLLTLGGMGLSIFNSWDGMTWKEVPVLDRVGFFALSVAVGGVAMFVTNALIVAVEKSIEYYDRRK